MSIDSSLFMAFLEPAHLVIIAILYAIGTFLKHDLRIRDNFIPLILAGVSLVLCTLLMFANHELPGTSQGVMELIFNLVVQVFATTAGSVYTNQLKVQLFDKMKEEEENTNTDGENEES